MKSKELVMCNKIKQLKEQLENISGKEKVDVLTELAFSFYTSEPEKTQKYSEQALELALELDYKKGIARSYNNLGISYSVRGEYAKAIEVTLKAVEVDAKAGNDSGVAASYNNIGLIYKNQGNYLNAIEYFMKAVDIHKQFGVKNRMAGTYNNIGIIYLNQGNYNKALEYLFNALKLQEDIAEKTSAMANTLNNIGAVYKSQNNLSKALGYYFRSLEIRKKIGDKKGIAGSYNNIGEIYHSQGQIDKALQYSQKSLTIREELNDKKGIANCYGNMGDVFLDKGDVEKALENYLYCLKIEEEIGDKRGIAASHITIGNLQIDLYNYDMALNHLKIGVQLSKEVGSKTEEMEAYLGLSRLYEVQSFFAEALKYYKAYTTLEREIFNAEKNKQFAEMQTKYETEKKEKEAEIYRLKNVELAEANVTKDKFFSIIAHDLKHPLSIVVGYADMASKLFEKSAGQKLKDYIQKIDKSANHLQNLLGNLLEWARSQTGRLSYSPEKFDLKGVIEHYIEFFRENTNAKGIEIWSAINEATIVYADKNMITMVIRNLLSNAIKFTEEDGEILIESNNRIDFIEIAVIDNGVGMTSEKVDKLFKIGEKHISTDGTDGEKGTGLGLILCKEFVEKHGGTIWVESQEGEGSTFYFTLPKE